MLEALKSSFRKPTLPTVQASSADDPVKAEERWRLEQGRTRTRVENLTVELENARDQLAQAKQTLGEGMADDLDVTAATTAMQRASERVRVLEAALDVATKKDTAAQAHLKEARRQLVIAADDEAVAVAKTSALKMEALLSGEVQRAAEEFGAAFKAVTNRCPDDNMVASAQQDVRGWFPVYLRRACVALIPGGRAHSNVLDEQKKPFAAWIDDLAYQVAQRRTNR